MFLYSKWLSLDLPTRARIASELGIIKKGSTHVQDNRIVSDGYEIHDVENALSIENMQRVLHSANTDMAILWDMLTTSKPSEDGIVVMVPLEQVKEEKVTESSTVESTEKVKVETPVITTKKKGRSKKNA